MTEKAVARCRQRNQRIAGSRLSRPADVVRWLGAVQAQDYGGALWAIGLRMKEGTGEEIERAIAEKRILRTWLLRGTLHFVVADDLRSMLHLLAPRIIARSERRMRELRLDATTILRSRKLLERGLQGGERLTRKETFDALESAGIATGGQRGIFILWRLALDGVLSFGALDGKQQTFVLLDEWCPGFVRLKREEALADLAGRYIASHGPATAQDFAWWSGLPVREALRGLESSSPRLLRESSARGAVLWRRGGVERSGTGQTARASLLPPFDEYIVGYRDRSAIVDMRNTHRMNAGGGMIKAAVVIDGRVVGTWRRELKRGGVEVRCTPFTSFGQRARRSIDREILRYRRFLGKESV